MFEIPVLDLLSWEKKTRRAIIYDGKPFGSLSYCSRGKAFEEIAGILYSEKFGEVKKSDNRKYDFYHTKTGDRIEVKSASASYRKCGWSFAFSHIKCNGFDVLILVFYFPDRVEIWRWDPMTIGVLVSQNREDRQDIIGKRLWFCCDKNFVLSKVPGVLLDMLHFHA